MVKYYEFPYDKVEKNSKVVIYGAKNIGKLMINQAKGYCEVVAVIDQYCGIQIENYESQSPEIITNIDFDNIIISASDIYFDEMYKTISKLMKYEHLEKIISPKICVKARKECGDVCVKNENYHWHVEDIKFRNQKINEINELLEAKNNKIVSSSTALAELLVNSYNYVNPLFHIVDKKQNYLGSLGKTEFRILGNLWKTEFQYKDVGDIIDILKNRGYKCYIALEDTDTVNAMYSIFEKKNITEIPIVDGGMIKGFIDRIIFNAIFKKYDSAVDELIIDKRETFIKASGLNKFSYNINSQNGEDGILEYIFKVIKFKSKYAVEFGAWDGIYLSNIRNLVLKNDMNAIFIEGDKTKANEGKKNYKDNEKVKFVNEYVGIKKYKKLNLILSENKCPMNIDLLSIDVDGWDYWIWDSLVEYRPRIVVIEYMPNICLDDVVISPRDELTRTGSSARAFVELGKKKRYELICVTACNLIFCIQEEYNKFNIKDNSLEALGVSAGNRCPVITLSGDIYEDVWGRDKKHALPHV